MPTCSNRAVDVITSTDFSLTEKDVANRHKRSKINSGATCEHCWLEHSKCKVFIICLVTIGCCSSKSDLKYFRMLLQNFADIRGRLSLKALKIYRTSIAPLGPSSEVVEVGFDPPASRRKRSKTFVTASLADANMADPWKLCRTSRRHEWECFLTCIPSSQLKSNMTNFFKSYIYQKSPMHAAIHTLPQLPACTLPDRSFLDIDLCFFIFKHFFKYNVLEFL